jgi:ribosomal protein S18 acetylase RimI-like enzyme
LKIDTFKNLEIAVNIRPTKSKDIPALKAVLDGTGLFPSEILAAMMGGFLGANENNEVWLTSEINNEAVGFCYAAPEKLADGCWNMLAIAVVPSLQGKGLGRAIVKYLENHLEKEGHRILIADTSGTDQFKQTRAFYKKIGYTEEARIRDFWAIGDDKIIFWKSLK